MNLHVNLPVFSAYARNVLANMPKPTAAAAALIRHPDLPSNEFQCVQAKRSSRKLVRNWRRDRAGECLSDAFWPANRPTPAASQEQPRAQNRETGGELAHRSLITDVLQFRRQAADQCPPEPRANPRRMSELALFGNGASPHFRLRLKKQTQQNAGNRIPILRRKTAFMFEGKKAFPHSDNL
jgi:hypothetical protein